MSDVCLILEGIYLHVSGGVSVWVDNMIRSMPDVSFSIMHVSPSQDKGKPYVRQMPRNVVEVKEVFPFDYETTTASSGSARERAAAWGEMEEIYRRLIAGEAVDWRRMLNLVRGPGRPLSTHDLTYSPEAWELVTKLYDDVAPTYSFIDFFWTWRFTQMPLMRLLDTTLPAARVYHAVSTGYAGFLGALARHDGAERFIVTEHGIYTRERSLEISQADWIYTPETEQPVIGTSPGLVKAWWQQMFAVFANVAYTYADRVVTLFEGNRLHQLAGGADPARTMIIPNGIDCDRYDRPHGDKKEPRTVGFMGRVVPIKDLMTFVRAAKIVRERMPSVRFLVMGSTDEDPLYVAKCKRLAEVLGLDGCLTFTGSVTAEEYYPQLDVIVLTSLSEGQPLSIIEAMAAGVPVVATQVGACEEMLAGRTKEDAELGPSGITTSVSSPAETADAVMRILSNERLWQAMSRAGRERARRFYRLDEVTRQYLDLYQISPSEIK